MQTFITINKKSVRIEITGNEAKSYANRVRYAAKLQDEKVNRYWSDIKARGACPNCRLVLPLTKYCSRCQKSYK